MRFTKIVATLGPASRDRKTLDALIAAGMDVVRLNFSHGEVADHAITVRRVRQAARAAGLPIAIMQDLQGPRIRIGQLAERVVLAPGKRVALLSRDSGARAPRDLVALPYTFGSLHRDVAPGARILLKDGVIELRILESTPARLVAKVVRGGEVGSGTGMNFPDSTLDVPALTRRDREHIAAGVKMGVDAVALSFVRDAADIKRARALLHAAGSDALVVAKIERSAALENLDEILVAADGAIVARGDLGVECSMENVPLLQKDMIRRAIRSNCFVITATQMLESMVNVPMPTRAEVSDVANAVLDGSDAVMLSAETAVGKNPVEAVAWMDKIARSVEAAARIAVDPMVPPGTPPDDFTAALAEAAVALAEQSSAAAIVTFTLSGRAAAVLSARRPSIPIEAFTPDPRVARKLAFHRGVRARTLARQRSCEAMFARGLAALAKARAADRDDVVVLLGGYAMAGAANMVKVARIVPR